MTKIVQIKANFRHEQKRSCLNAKIEKCFVSVHQHRYSLSMLILFRLFDIAFTKDTNVDMTTIYLPTNYHLVLMTITTCKAGIIKVMKSEHYLMSLREEGVTEPMHMKSHNYISA